MNYKTAHKVIRKMFEEPLAYLGFSEVGRVDPPRFVRGPSDVLQTLQFGGRIDAYYHFMFGFNVGVRFLAIERILRPETLEQMAPTVWVPIHLLREDTGYTEWRLENSSPPLSLNEEILKEIKHYGFPYWERYSDLDRVRIALETNDRNSRCCVFGPEQKLETLAAIEAVQGRVNRALEMLDQAIERERKAPAPAARLYIERARRRICAAKPQPSATITIDTP